MAGYKIVYSGGSGEIVEKKSRFIANVFPVENEEDAARIIGEVKKKYWDARHNCYAYIIGENPGISKCSDDGEPSGTAGKPILEVLSGAGVCDVLVIVTRYFGGILLGTGGLARAYSGAAKAGLAASRVIVKEAGKRIILETGYDSIGKIQYIISQMGLAVIDTRYSDKMEMELAVSSGDAGQFVKKVTEATSGQVKINADDDIYFAVIDQKPVIF
ncbi:MAG: YigZ family protein [Lachnospiraceae bacterium]|nr:YigZ family protein [Lachnospiraceae bacterium]